MYTIEAIRSVVAGKLEAAGKNVDLSDDTPLFSSGRLDSLAATDLLMQLEADFGLDLADADFDVTLIDTLAGIAALVSNRHLPG